MARLLRDLDYLRVIQADNLDQIIESNQQTKLDVEQAAQAEMISYLSQRYLVNQVFTNTTVFDISAVYHGKNLVEYTAPAFSATTIYLTGNRVVQNGSIYESIAGSAAHNFNVSEWTLITADKTLYYLKLPQLEYVNTTTYSVGSMVWYLDKVYTCSIACVNILPTNISFWSAGSTYSVTGVLPTDTTKWTKGDNRNQQIILYLLDITLYHLHSRINPRNIPDLRKERYDGNSPHQSGGAIAWLKRCGSGDVTADLPQIDPQQGLSIRWNNSNGVQYRASNIY